MNHEELTNDILSLSGRDNQERVYLCDFYLNKHHMENYSLKQTNIRQEDYILRDNCARELCSLCIKDNRCSENDIRFIIGKMSYDDLVYMGI